MVWSYSGVRPLYDDGASDPSSITRDYVFKLDADDGGGAAALSIYGGKITTYRKLAEHALDELTPFLPPMRPRWTRARRASRRRPAGRRGGLERGAHPALSGAAGGLMRGLARRHGTRALAVLGDAKNARRSRRGFRPRTRRGRDRLPRARGMGARRRRRAVAPDQVRHRHDRRASASRVAAYVASAVCGDGHAR